MRRHIPSTRALLIFDAVARHHGVGKAAEELCLTHSAVSQQLRLLETQIGVRLVQRTARGTELTEAGRRYHGQVSGDLLRLQNHTLEAMAQRTDGLRLLVGAVPVLAEGWLMPRLPDFIARHPGCSLHLQVFPTYLYMEDMPFDVGVQYDDAVWPGANALPLMGESCVAVCAPGAKGRAAMARGDFRAAPLLQLRTRLGAWEEWFAQTAHARAPENLVAGHRFDLFSTLIAAVRADLGVGLVPAYFVERELRSGELVLACPHRAPSSRGYSVFVAPSRTDDPLIGAFVAWLRETAAEPQPQLSAAQA
ncbi:LysR substrate-binding domain-containing protein [Variovorax sp. J22G73]|uniref:LysR substrate-binding domain-containing protein n=1 Tax=unclassified Variovorax TaxID=663243 RepID=UPI000E32AD5A|nr:MULTISPECIES: LysR substrate-binding domain-containing protein [unclassified Variovorax]MDM0003664.1 LysR substrate-binding domain-containing protein [Variovorax sp. J22R203]MDM0096670.1 LysR substrate-binding domain-containing protein [Variovorax sp. J22G73]